MSTQHTPGQWKMGFNFTNEQAIIGKDGKVVADASWTGGSGCELSIDNPADANLITAAPDLLEALQDLFDADMEHVLMGDGKDDQIEAIAKARAAIAKATGETK
jgi:hypothetical protein